MMEPRAFPYGGVPVYNPQSLSKTEALAQFHARQASYQSLMDTLREERPSHVLIIGTRGMGKTTLLQRVRYGVQDDPELNRRYLALVFPEEQYNVNRLHHFLLNTLDALADAMERLHNKETVKRIEREVEEIGKRTPEEIEERVPQFLAEVGNERQTSFLLLVDNADRLFETIEDQQQWALRQLLSSRRDLTFFGATTQASEGIYGSDRAFFEFFKIHRLGPLMLDEVRALLLRLSENVEEKEGEKGSAKRRVAEWLDADPARLRTLVQLTGGNPRTTVLLFHLVLDGLQGGAREYLEQLLDQVTPGYKGRVDELPAQAQQVLDAVALRWDPVTAMEVADDTGLETTAVSSQLTRLARQGILEKVDPGDSKKALYQVAERFFNIWYLMRASRRVRAKLRWFVEFLRVFFESGELEQMAWERIERHRSTWREHPQEVETAFAYLFASGAPRERIEKYFLQKCKDSEALWRPFVDSMESPASGGSDGGDGPAGAPSQIDTEAELRRAIDLDPKSAKSWAALGVFLGIPNERTEEAEDALRRAIGLDPEVAGFWIILGMVLSRMPGRREDEEEAYRRALELDSTSPKPWAHLANLLAKTPERAAEAEAAYRKAIDLDPTIAWFWNGLGDLLAKISERTDEAELAYRKAISLGPTIAWFWDDLGDLLAKTSERAAEAEAAYRKAIELDPMNAVFWNDIGDLLGRISERATEAEVAYRKAAELEPKEAWRWNKLGGLLAKTPERTIDAEAAYEKATELEPGCAGFWHNLGSLLAKTPGRATEAEAAHRRAVALEPTTVWFWNGLGNLLARTPERAAEAEAAYRKAIELDPKCAGIWNNLGNLLVSSLERIADGEAAFRRATELDPTGAGYWGSLGAFLACRAGRPKDAEAALRNSVRFGPDEAPHIRNLGVLLYCELDQPEEAVTHLDRAHQLRPEDPVSAAILAASLRDSERAETRPQISINAAREPEFWDELLELCQNYPPFGKLLSGICDLVQQADPSNRFAGLYRAVALAQIGDFPRASVAFEDALTGDPIDLLSLGQRAIEAFLAAAVRNGRVRDCLDAIDKKEWKDAWRPIYEALRAAEAGSAVYLKRIAVEIRGPAVQILRRIAPKLPDLPERAG
jgi:Flp pilus assembly protein TadD